MAPEMECADAMGKYFMHTLSRNHEEENVYMHRYIAHKNQQYHDDALVGQRSQCFCLHNFLLEYVTLVKCCYAWRSLPSSSLSYMCVGSLFSARGDRGDSLHSFDSINSQMEEHLLS